MLRKEQERTAHCMGIMCSTHFKSIEVINTHKLGHAFFTEQMTFFLEWSSVLLLLMQFILGGF